MATKRHNEKVEWIIPITRELEELEEGQEAEIHTDLRKIKLKKISNWKTPGHDGKYGFMVSSLRNSPPFTAD